MKNKTVINEFRGEYKWLSNFEECTINYKGRKYKNSEAAYMAAKTDNEEIKDIFSKLCPRCAKAASRVIKLIPNWDEVRLSAMEEILFCKFNQNKDLREKLIATGDRELIEGNTWNDTFWGVCNGVGENNLGKILMKIRASYLER